MKIALNSYSLRNDWGLFMMDDYAPLIKLLKNLNIDSVELLDRHYDNKLETLLKLKQKLKSEGIDVFSLGPHPHLLTNPENFETAIKEGKECVDIAASTEVPRFRVSIGGGKYNPESREPKDVDQAVEWALAVFNPVIEYAESKGITLCIETHHNYSSDPEWQEKMLQNIRSKNFGFIFDVGNYEDDERRWKSLDVLIKYKAVKYVHAKCYEFDENGFETTLDYPRAIKLLHENNFDINLSIEWEGKMGGGIGVMKTYELCKYSIAKAEEKDYQMKTEFPDEEEIMDNLLDID